MDEARKWTDARLEDIENELLTIYKRAQAENAAAWNEYLLSVEKELAELEKMYKAAVESGAKEEAKRLGKKLGQLKKEKTLFSDRFASIAQMTAENISHTNEIALAYINGQLPAVYVKNYNALKDVVQTAIKGYSFSTINQNVVSNLIKEKRILLPTKTINQKKDVRWNLKKLNSEVLQGILQGESMDKIAARFQKVQNMNADSAIRNARTMVTAAENGGRFDSYCQAEKDGVVLEKYWIKTNDSKTRDWHAQAGIDYGKENSISIHEPFIVDGEELMFPGDGSSASGHNVYNCRCSMASKVVGFNLR